MQEAELAEMPRDMVRPEALDEARIEDLIAQHLTHNLEILPESVSEPAGVPACREASVP